MSRWNEIPPDFPPEANRDIYFRQAHLGKTFAGPEQGLVDSFDQYLPAVAATSRWVRG